VDALETLWEQIAGTRMGETFYAEGERDTFAMLQDVHFNNIAASIWLVMLLQSSSVHS
jgi:hypothetical protein